MLDRTFGRKFALLAPAMVAASSVAWGQTPLPDDVVAPDTMRPAGEAVEAAMQEAEDNISGSVGVDWATHFVSYGADVWGGGNDFFNGRATNFVWAELAFDLPGDFGATLGVWSDLNNNVDSEIGGAIQEIDVYAGLSYTFFEKLTVGATYQEWYYAGDEERIADFSAAFDDTDMLIDGFAFKPSVIWHYRLEGNGAQEEGSIVVASIEPSFTLVDSEDYPLTLTIPAGVGILIDEDFHGGDDNFGYAFVGATLGIPLAFIPEAYGAWNVAGNLTYYYTNEDAIPGNPDEDFLTGMVSLSLSF